MRRGQRCLFFLATVFLASGANSDVGTVYSTFLPQKSSKKLGEGFKQGRTTPEKRPFRRSFGFLTVTRFSVRFATSLNIHH
jgi:hypothetical protein